MRVAVAFLLAFAVVGTHACTSGNSFDFLALVQQYAPVDCPQSAPVNCNGTNDAFGTLHGLWPSVADDGPCTCTNEQFQLSVVQPFIDEMNKFWPSYDGPNVDFWTHEYEKHGTCAESVPQLATQLDFFKTTLSLVQKYNFVALLKSGGIYPNDNTPVSRDNFLQVLTTAFGGSPSLDCKNGMLDAVSLCLDKSLNPTDCTGMKHSCDSTFTYPVSQQP